MKKFFCVDCSKLRPIIYMILIYRLGIMHLSKYVVITFCKDQIYHKTESIKDGFCQAPATSSSSSGFPNLRAHCNMKIIY